MLRIFVVSLLAVLAGCTAKYQVHNLAGATAAPKLDRGKVVFVAIPQDGTFGTITAAGSGQIAAQAIATAFSTMAARVQVAAKPVENDQNIPAAKSAGAGYLVVPVIAQWEQRATEWSGRPSRLAIRLTIFDVATGELLASTAIEGRSRIVSFISTSPESLLRDPLAEYVRGLY